MAKRKSVPKPSHSSRRGISKKDGAASVRKSAVEEVSQHPPGKAGAPLDGDARPATDPEPDEQPGKGASEPFDPEPAGGSILSERAPSKSFPIVGIGASAGGTGSLHHFPPGPACRHRHGLCAGAAHGPLAREPAQPVAWARHYDAGISGRDGMEVEPNCVYVIPPNTEMTVDKGRLRLVARSGEVLRHTPIDSFLCALAEDQQSLAIGIVLSGRASWRCWWTSTT